jgi:hypothetical protein
MRRDLNLYRNRRNPDGGGIINLKRETKKPPRRFFCSLKDDTYLVCRSSELLRDAEQK